MSLSWFEFWQWHIWSEREREREYLHTAYAIQLGTHGRKKDFARMEKRLDAAPAIPNARARAREKLRNRKQ